MHTSTCRSTHRNTLFMGLDDRMTHTDVVALSIIQQQQQRSKKFGYNFKVAASYHLKSTNQSASHPAKERQ